MTEAAVVETPIDRRLRNLIPAKPGEVRNPLGKTGPSHTVAKYIREKTLDGTALVDFLLGVLNGEIDQYRSVKNKLHAVEILFNRGWGQAPQTIITPGGQPRPLFDLTKLSATEFEQFRGLALKIVPTVENEQESQSVQSVDASTASPVPRTATISGADVPKGQPTKNLGE